MSSSKFGKFMLYGALLGAATSLLDRTTRQEMSRMFRTSYEKALYYKENPDIVKNELQDKKEKAQSIFEQIKGDVEYVKAQVDEIKSLTPQVKEMLVDTKDTFVESKTEYQQLMEEAATSEQSQDLPMVQKKNEVATNSSLQ